MHEPTMTTGEAGHLLGVDAKTISRWVKAKKIPCYRTPGGHVRVFTQDVVYILKGGLNPNGPGPSGYPSKRRPIL